MTADEILARLRGKDRLRCQVCAGTSGHEPIEGDGFAICYACLIRCGRAADATTLSVGEAAMLMEAHGDLVELRECAKHIWCWFGFRGWPDVGEYTLIGEAA